MIYELVGFTQAFGFLVFVCLLDWFRKYQKIENQWVAYSSSISSTFGLLFVWSIFGYLYALDNSNIYGCGFNQGVSFSLRNFSFSAASILLISLGFLLRHLKVGLAFLAIELLCWLVKLFYIKEGYVAGYSAMPIPAVVGFDIIALALRLTLLKQAIPLKLRFWVIVVAVFFVINMKTMFFR